MCNILYDVFWLMLSCVDEIRIIVELGTTKIHHDITTDIYKQ